jgi:hypothetical protein
MGDTTGSLGDMTELQMLLACAKSLEAQNAELLAELAEKNARIAELERENDKIISCHKHDLSCIIATIQMSLQKCNHSGDWTEDQISAFHEKTLGTIEDACSKQLEILRRSEK